MPCFSSYSERFGTSLVLSVARIRTANTSSHHSTARSRSWPMPLRLRFLGIKSGFFSPRPPSPSRGDPCPFHPYLVRYCAVLSGMPLREGGVNNVRLTKKLGPIFGLAPHRLHLNWARLRTTAGGQYVVPSFWGIVFAGEADIQDVSKCHILQHAATRDACWPSTNFFEPRQHSSYKPRTVFSKKGQRASCVTIHAQGAVQHCI